MTDKKSVVKLLTSIESSLNFVLLYLLIIIAFLFLILISVASAEQQGHDEQAVEVKELITILEQARYHVWDTRMLTQVYTYGIFNPCENDPICAAEREVERMKERKALAERIDQVVKILKEANK